MLNRVVFSERTGTPIDIQGLVIVINGTRKKILRWQQVLGVSKWISVQNIQFLLPANWREQNCRDLRTKNGFDKKSFKRFSAWNCWSYMY